MIARKSLSATFDPFETALGALNTIELGAGPLRYRDRGSRDPVVFLAGLVLSSGFWRRLVPALQQPIRAIVPDLPLGAHTVAMRRDADLSPPAIADLVAELLDGDRCEGGGDRRQRHRRGHRQAARHPPPRTGQRTRPHTV